MRIFVAASAALLATTSIAAAELSRTDQSMRLLFEDVGPSGNYVELSFGSVRPEANPVSTNAAIGGLPNPLDNYTLPGLGFLHRVNEQISFALIYDQPFGADVQYPGFGSPTGAPFFGGNATVETDAVTLVGRYEFGNGFSIHAGARALQASGSIYTSVVAPTFNQLTGSSDTGYGYLVGAAYEMPDIALRVALTYSSAIEVGFDATEQTLINPGTGTSVAPAASTSFEVEFPESLNLEFQTGVAQDTLLFGSIRHVWWDGFNLTTGAGEYVSFTSDSTTYNIGIGRRFNENWSGSIAYTHRTEGTIPSDSALAPTTGLDSITLAGQYSMDAMTISGGITYGIPGDQVIENVSGPVNVRDNEVVAIGLRVGFRF
jgi:long-subunit fatty acid transport protein